MVSITERYESVADAYIEYWAPLLRRSGRELARQFEDDRPGTVIDVGCGVGALLPVLDELFPTAQIFGMDRTLGMLRRAEPRFGRAVLDATRLPVRANSVDLMLFCFMLFHLDDPADALREAHRVLRSGGRAGSLTWGASEPQPADDVWISCLDEFGAEALDPSLYSHHELVDTPEKMRTHFDGAGFTDVRTRRGELVQHTDPATFLAQKQGLGSQQPRYDSLDEDAQRACSREALRRFLELPPDAWMQRHSIIISQARTPT